MMSLVELQSDHWRLWLDPTRGMNLIAGQAEHDGQWVDLFPDCRHPASSLSEANFQMIPYSNRIRDGRFQFGGRTVQLADAERHAIHGALRKRPWTILRQSDDALTCTHDSEGDGDVNWPWRLHARSGWRIEDRLLHATLLIANRDSHAMPAGLGWHPYFNRTVLGASPAIRVPVNSVYPDANGDCLPDGAPVALPAELDFRQLRALDPNQRIDHCFAGLSGIAEIQWSAAGIGLSLAASDNCAHCIVFNPDAPHFAIEPVTNANDGFNLSAQGIDAGVIVLQPGEELEASFTLELERL